MLTLTELFPREINSPVRFPDNARDVSPLWNLWDMFQNNQALTSLHIARIPPIAIQTVISSIANYTGPISPVTLMPDLIQAIQLAIPQFPSKGPFIPVIAHTNARIAEVNIALVCGHYAQQETLGVYLIRPLFLAAV